MANAIPLVHVPPPPLPFQAQTQQQQPQYPQQRRNEITPLRNVQIPQFSNKQPTYCRVQPSQFPINIPRSSQQWHLFKSFELGMKALEKLTPINPDKYFGESDNRCYSKYSKVCVSDGVYFHSFRLPNSNPTFWHCSRCACNLVTPTCVIFANE